MPRGTQRDRQPVEVISDGWWWECFECPSATGWTVVLEAETSLSAALPVACRVRYFYKGCFLRNGGKISLCGGYKHDCPKSPYQVSHHSYCVEFKFKGAMSDSFHLALCRDKVFPVPNPSTSQASGYLHMSRHTSDKCVEAQEKLGKKIWEHIFHSEVSTFALNTIPKPNESESVIVT